MQAARMSSWVRRADRMVSAQLATYRRELSGVIAGRSAAALACPSCGMALEPWRQLPELRPCPRCGLHEE